MSKLVDVEPIIKRSEEEGKNLVTVELLKQMPTVEERRKLGMMYIVKDKYNEVLEYLIVKSTEEAEKAKKSWQDKGWYGIEVEEVKAEGLVKASEHSFDPYDSHSNKVDLDDYNELVWRVNKLMDYCNLLELRIKHLENQC